MACLIVPGVEGLVVFGVANVISAISKKHSSGKKTQELVHDLNSLAGYLLGGAFLLAIEHIWHGEIIFSYPFLTAMKSPEDTSIMLHEMATVGVSMALLVTSFWGFGLLCRSIKRHTKKCAEA